MARDAEAELLARRGKRTARTIGGFERLIYIAIESARFAGSGIAVLARHGGSVANAYRYRAHSEGIVVVVDVRRGVMGYAICSRINANKITYAGVVAHCCGEYYRAIFDPRYGGAKRLAAKKALAAELM